MMHTSVFWFEKEIEKGGASKFGKIFEHQSTCGYPYITVG